MYTYAIIQQSAKLILQPFWDHIYCVDVNRKFKIYGLKKRKFY